tara:strand:+ start:1799 stop:2842 length:1044 start_codon:yes stop_codon:yes gene_type:complete
MSDLKNIDKLKNILKKNKFTYLIFKPFVNIVRICFSFIFRNRSLLSLNNFSNKSKNIFILDTRIHSITFDSVVLLIRGSNFFYNDKWTLIIYEDDFQRYSPTDVNDEIYLNSLINIFLQSLLILPNPPNTIKFVNNSYELLQIINKSDKIFPEDYNFLSDNKAYKVEDFNEKDFQNFKKNKPILKANKYYSEIFENYLNYKNIKKYITITIRSKSWANNEWNTDLEDIKLYLDFIKKNNLNNYEVLIIPDTEQELPKVIKDFIEKNNLKYNLFHHSSFSVPMRFLAYSKASFNFGSTNGPLAMLWFMKNDAFFILKDSNQGEDVKNFVDKFNKNIFLDRKFYFHKRY